MVFSSGTVLELARFKEYPNSIEESGFREAGGFWLDMHGNVPLFTATIATIERASGL